MDKGKKITAIYLNSLLSISDKDEEITSQLLKNEGVDPEHLANDTLRKINNYEFALTKKVSAIKKEELLEKIMTKVASLLEKAPERVAAIMNGIIYPQVPAFRFKPASYTVDVADIFDTIDPYLLLEKLEALEQEIG